MEKCIMVTSIMDTSILDTCTIGSCIIDICMIDSCIIEVEKEVLVDFQLPKGAKHHTYMRQGQGSNSFLPSFRNKNSAASSWTCLLIVPSDAHKKSHSRDALFSSSFHVLCYECLLTGRMKPLSLWTTLFRIARFVHIEYDHSAWQNRGTKADHPSYWCTNPTPRIALSVRPLVRH